MSDVNPRAPSMNFSNYGHASRQLTDLLLFAKTASDREIWTYEVLKRHAGAARARAAELKKLHSRSAVVEAGGGSGCLPNVLKVVLSNALDAVADTVAFEAFLREELMPTLEKALKHREQKLKKRTKQLVDYLHRLESADRAYTRASSDLNAEQRKFADLKRREALNRAEDIEKVEIDLRRVGSSLNVKQAEFEVCQSRFSDASRTWQTDWEGFRNYARQIEIERSIDVRNAMLGLSRAIMVVKQAETNREQSLSERLQALDILSEVANAPVFAGLPALSGAADTPALSATAIASRLWPGSTSSRPLDADQLASLSSAPASISRPRIRPANLAMPPPSYDTSTSGALTPTSMMSSTSSHSSHSGTGSSPSIVRTPGSSAGQGGPIGTPSRKSAAPAEYGEEMFSVRRKAVPVAFQPTIALDEFGNLQKDIPTPLGKAVAIVASNAGWPKETPRKVSKPLPGLPSGLADSSPPFEGNRAASRAQEARPHSAQAIRIRTIGSDGSLCTDKDAISVTCLGETPPMDDFEASLDASLTQTPPSRSTSARKDTAQTVVKKRASVPPSLPSFSDFKLVAQLDSWLDAGGNVGSRSSLITATLDVR